MSRLLILDDDPAVGATITAMVEGEEIECRSAASANDFFEVLQSWKATHILLDLKMPEVDGIEIIQRLAKQQCKAEIIIMSGSDSRILEAAQRSGQMHGLNIGGVVAKPFSLKALRAVVGQRKAEQPAARPSARSGTAFEIRGEDITAALEAHQFFLAFQPKVSCSTGEMLGFEVLLRWSHPEHGLIPPDQFIPVAEASGTIHALTEWVVTAGLEFMLAAPVDNFTLALNFSALSIGDYSLADRLAERCAEYQIPTDRLIIEVTETNAVGAGAETLDVFTRLRLKGFSLSIDDFGVGYSSFVRLARLPFSEIKIDKEFVIAAQYSAEARTIITAIVSLAHGLGVVAVAEGVEDLAVFSFLKDIGCDYAQGFFIGKPMPACEAIRWRSE